MVALGAMAVRCTAIDIQHKRIYNRDIAFFAAIIAGLYGVLLMHSWWGQVLQASFGKAGMSFYVGDFFWGSALHAGMALGLAVGLWLFGIWPAGDAKLYFLLATLVPLIAPDRLGLSFRLPLMLLVNIFVPAALVFLGKAFYWLWNRHLAHGFGFFLALGRGRVLGYGRDILRGWVQEAGEYLRKERADAVRDPRGAAKRVLSFAVLTVFGAFVITHLELTMPVYRYSGPLAGFVVVLVWRELRNHFSDETLAGLTAVAVVGAIGLSENSFWSVFRVCLIKWSFFGLLFGAGTALLRRMLAVRDGFTTFLALLSGASALGLLPILFPYLFTGMVRSVFLWSGFGVVFGIIYALMRCALEEDITYVPAELIHPRLVLASSVWESLRADEDVQDSFRRRYPDGLTVRQAEALREWCQERSIGAVAVRQTEPFAMWIFVGVFLTIVLQRDVVTSGLAFFV